jgi:hypothetical protein
MVKAILSGSIQTQRKALRIWLRRDSMIVENRPICRTKNPNMHHKMKRVAPSKPHIADATNISWLTMAIPRCFMKID